MKRTVPLFVLVGVVGLLVPVLAVFAQPSCYLPPKQSGVSCTSPGDMMPYNPAKVSSTNDKIIEELMAILKETKSPQTFLVTVQVLGTMGSEAKCAVPAIIRNAERLELLDDLYNTGVENGNKIATEKLGNALEMILVNKASARRRIVQPPPQVYYAPAPSYPSPVTSYGYAPGAGVPAPTIPSVTPAPCPAPTAPTPTIASPKNTKTTRLVPQQADLPSSR